MSDAAPSDLLLKVTPPRVPRHLVARASLDSQRPVCRDAPFVLVQAPAGFGKTSLLAQWRREHLAHGAGVAWLSSQPHDDPRRFVQALALAVRVGAGRPTFGHVLLDATPADGLEGVTAWLAEVAQSALNVVLFVDEADRLPAATRDLLAYLLHNAPPNLRTVVAARPDYDLGVADLVAYGACTVVGATQLRFRLDEALELVRSRCGGGVSRDEAARLHEMTEGWPLGLQLALSVMESGRGDLPVVDLHGGALRTQFVGLLLRNLDPADLALLTQLSVPDLLHPDLAAAMVPEADVRERLARLVRDTPVFVAGEQGEWLRMHSLARDVLRQRFDALPAPERSGLHERAAGWLSAHAMVDAAADHALAAGQDQLAYGLAERSLYESLMSQGRQATVLAWLHRLPPAELERRPRLLLAAAWSLASSERHAEAKLLVERLLAAPDADENLRWECALILGGAANFADDVDRFAELHDPWAEAPPVASPFLLQIHANRTAFRALLAGEPAVARLKQQQAPNTPGYLNRWGEFIIALSYLWEGQVILADQLLRPVLASADADMGRRSPLACTLAALHAAALWERDQPEEAMAVLANRLDVIERSALPEAVLLAYRTLARIAAATQSESRAVELLGGLDAIGAARRLPRLRIASLVEQVRMHARRFRGATCSDLCAELDAMLADPAQPQGPLWQRGAVLQRALAQGYAAIAATEWRRALEPLARADEIARTARLGRLHIELLGLRALALDRCGERESTALLREALGLAEAHGLQRVFADAHPALGEWVQMAQGQVVPAAAAPIAPLARPGPAPKAIASNVLTPKEREVLELLARNLSNKEVGLALQVGEETVKWHVKNLFAKLDAGTRKQVVSRARILGLLAG
jgi:LuxR family transcriptional regulator, maltose regulon positive regulatory protein